MVFFIINQLSRDELILTKKRELSSNEEVRTKKGPIKVT